MDKKAKDILFKTYWSSKGWKGERVTDPDNYIYAKEKGESIVNQTYKNGGAGIAFHK